MRLLRGTVTAALLTGTVLGPFGSTLLCRHGPWGAAHAGHVGAHEHAAPQDASLDGAATVPHCHDAIGCTAPPAVAVAAVRASLPVMRVFDAEAPTPAGAVLTHVTSPGTPPPKV